MRLLWFGLIFLFTGHKSLAIVHKKTKYFLDLELNRQHFLITCSGGPEDDNSIVSFDLMDWYTHYSFYYRRTIRVKECHRLQKEYMDMLFGHNTVRIVGSHPDEGKIINSKRKTFPPPFNKAKKHITSFFIRLQAGDKCKAYFSEDCDLPKNYWGGVTPEK